MSEQDTTTKSRFSIFIIIWIGQLISLLGTGMTGLGLPIWVFQQTHRATDMTWIQGTFMLALLAGSLFAGVLIDRGNRKLMMMLSDLAAGAATLGIFVLFSLGRLQIWHLYVSAAIQGLFQAFQWPAFSAAISTMFSKEHYTRASTMLDLANTASLIFAPILAGALFALMGDDTQTIRLILLIDVMTFLIAVGTLLFIHVPQPRRTAAQEEAEKGGLPGELTFGLRYIFARPSLLGLQLVFMIGNLLVSISQSLMPPLLLARTDSNELIFGSVMTFFGVGGVGVGVAISAWGGFKRRVHGVLAGWAVSGILGTSLFGLGRAEPAWMGLPIWAASVIFGGLLIPLINGSNQGIWQSKVSPDIQGKVFTARRLIAWLVIPVANYTAGPLADQLLEPAMATGGSLVPVFGWLVGSGPGAGMSLAFIFTGLLASCIGLGGYLVPAIRNAEDLLPDHDQVGGLVAEDTTAETIGAAEAGSAAR